ncbi:MAG TPA: class I SAM-dependent methyltransferase [Puia sp.]|nr:class I SAM-dependent methyltransferase [Puia sp.]
MKEIVKRVFYFLFKIITLPRSSFFSRFLISFGYLLKSEGLYNHSRVRAFKNRMDMHRHLVSQYLSPDEKIHFMEFGVFWGQTFRIWVEGNRNPQTRFAGFDTFTGLPEDWGSEKKGSFSAEGRLPDIHDPRIEWQVGLIQDTLPTYTGRISKEEKKVIHIDVDLYNASLITLIHVQPFLQPGDIIIFDDFFTFTKTTHEFKAFYDFLDLFKTSYAPIFKSRPGHLVIRIE